MTASGRDGAEQRSRHRGPSGFRAAGRCKSRIGLVPRRARAIRSGRIACRTQVFSFDTMAPPQPHPSHQPSKRKLSSKADLWGPWFATRQVQLKCRRLRRCELVPLARMLQYPWRSYPDYQRAATPPFSESERLPPFARYGYVPSLWVFHIMNGRAPHPQGGVQFCDSRPAHSITSSARASSEGGTVMPSIRAVSALMTISNLLACRTGRSNGLAPLRMRPV